MVKKTTQDISKKNCEVVLSSNAPAPQEKAFDDDPTLLDELKRRLSANEPKYTTDEVLRYLTSLDRAAMAKNAQICEDYLYVIHDL